MKTELSVVVPFYNEEENLSSLHEELLKVLSSLSIHCEILYVNDGSLDLSEEKLTQAIKKKISKKVEVKIITLRRNFGQTAATSAGINKASGEYVAFLDADLQNDPQDLALFLEEIKKGYDAVFGWRKNRKDDFLRTLLSGFANFIIRKVFAVPIHDSGCALRIIRREALEDLHMYGEVHRIMPVLIYWSGAKIKELVVNHRPRAAGRSKYGYSRILKLVIDLLTVKFLTSYGTKPSYIFGTVGLMSIFFGFLALVMVAYRKLVLGVYVHRDPLFLVTVFLVLLGVQFILMGLIAELVVRTYFESQKKSIYEIKRERSF